MGSSLYCGNTAVMRGILEEFSKGKILKYSLLLAVLPQNRLDQSYLGHRFTINVRFITFCIKKTHRNSK